MKPIKFLPVALIAVLGLAASCSTSRLAQTTATDDVYNSVAKAKEVEYRAPVQQQQVQTDDSDEYYGTSNPYYDMDYSSRINRFYNGYSWRGYYDPYYDNYYYNNNYLGYGLSWYNGYGLGIGGGYYSSIWNNPYNYGYGSIWNSPYYGWNSWGPYSYYDRFGWGGGYYGGGGNYGGGVYTNRNNRPRPGSNDTGIPRSNGTINNTPNYGRPSRSGSTNPNNGITNRGYNPNGNMMNRPSRTQQSGNSQPQRTESRPTRNENYSPQQPQRTESRPSYNPPPSNNGGNGGSSGGGGSRPSRAGRG